MKWHRKLLLGAGVLVALGTAPAWAQEAAADAPAAAAAGDKQGEAVRDPDKRVCRRTVVTGSRLATLVCHTQAEWDDLAHATRSTMREMDSMPVQVDGQKQGPNGLTSGP
ncbi:MAG: hypothetical protein QM601_03745 [Pseudoxanthomonas sp.]